MANETFNILKILIENPEARYSIRKLSLLRKINYKSAYQAVMKLKKQGIIEFENLGNVINCSFNKKINPLVFKVEYERRKELLKNKNFKIIYERLNELKFPFIALMFGSYAKKTARKSSDIDLLVIAEKQKEIEQAIELIPLKIHLTIISYKEFIEMNKSKEFSVVSEANKNNIIMLGIEEYYRLIKNA
ncbi:hypothetical protein AYK26_02410 [Euryarchaeota archaeon SM23-78]|nr:MAG: hypothetical protein AYK26_02410 [Euryarchaeota archaeon SM23-78]MBW3001202.1 nucleotidyltransferase domain-containing protein [Candidatus Woesearchaeota archaeon]